MNILESSSPQRGRAAVVFLVVLAIVVAALVGGGIYFRPRFDSEPPQISLSPQADVMGLAPLEIDVSDRGTGLKSLTATLVQGGAEHTLASEQYPTPVPGKKIGVSLAKVSGIKEGPAVLRPGGQVRQTLEARRRLPVRQDGRAARPARAAAPERQQQVAVLPQAPRRRGGGRP